MEFHGNLNSLLSILSISADILDIAVTLINSREISYLCRSGDKSSSAYVLQPTLPRASHKGRR
jgi:hypothetical protein